MSLAEYLGAEYPASTAIAAPEEFTAALDLDAKDFCKALLNTKQYRQSLMDRITLGTLASAVECRLWDYAAGKPTEKVEVKNTTSPFEGLTMEALEDRAAFLLNLIRELKQSRDEDVSIH